MKSSMEIREISQEQLAGWKKEGKEFQLIDVREEREHLQHNIGGDLIPLSELNRLSHKIQAGRPVVFYCRKGIRSRIAIQRLQSKFPNTEFYNLTSGLMGF